MRFTIRSLMIAVVVVAIPLALLGGWRAIVAVLYVPCFSLIHARWLVVRSLRRLAAASFGTLAVLANTLYAACGIAPDIYLFNFLSYGWVFIVLPAILGPGTAWAILSSREGAVPQRSGLGTGLVVLVLAVMPLFTLVSGWPLQLAFLAAKPAMERLADQVAAGKAVAFPQRVGMYRVVKSAYNPVTGNVALMIDPNPNGPTGFVRVGRGPSPSPAGPIIGSDLDIELGGGWWYREED